MAVPMKYSTPLKQEVTATPTETLEERFQRLSALWHDETAYLSSSTASAEHPAYQEIIRMGPAALPLILRDLEKTLHHWFFALRAITGADPVPAEHRGKIDSMAADWLRWGRANGHL